MMRIAVAMACGFFFSVAPVWAAPPGPDPIGVDGGQIVGRTVDGVTAHLGVPFAAPPTGERRWRPPQAVAPWQGVRQAAAFAPACVQDGVSMPGEAAPQTSEDCLYLNVWAPTGAQGAPLPVLVWIYGGGFANGASSMSLYHGDALARRGVVVVTLAYRVGPLGFLAHPELTAESAHATSGNYGLMDQVSALEWVQRNIAAFGGDPDRVTIAGQSAGAMSVSMLMASPLAEGLFHRAIGQSGGVFEPIQLAPHWTLTRAEQDGVGYAASVGAASLAELRALPAEALLQGRASAISHPVVEPRVLPRLPYDVFAAGEQNDTPILVGYNVEEARALTDVSVVTAENHQALLAERWGPLPPPIIAAYPFATDAEAQRARVDLERDLRFGWDMRAWARLQAATGDGTVHAYLFTRRPPFPAGSPQEGWGAAHFAELWYMFGRLDQEPGDWTEADRALSEAMSAYWVNFIRSADPNGGDLPTWPAFGQDEAVLHLGDRITVGAFPDAPALDVFDAVYGALRAAAVPVE